MLASSFRTLALLALVCTVVLLEVDARHHRKSHWNKKGDVDDTFDVDGPARRSLEVRRPAARRHRKVHGNRKQDADDSFDVNAPSERSLEGRTPRKTIKQKSDEKKNAGLTILLTSDSHGKAGADWSYVGAHPLPDADVLIHCGDITDLGRLDEYKTVIKYFSEHKAKKKLFIGGNHDLTLVR